MMEGSYFMYSDDNKHMPEYRANDEFLRRMLGGELVGGELLRLPTEKLDRSEERYERRVDCRGNLVGADSTCGEKVTLERMEVCDRMDCPNEIHAPALAMVYSPKQCWRNLLDPRVGLEHGSIFAELILPFEGCPKKGRMEVKSCK